MISHRERTEVGRRRVFAETRGILAKYAEEERRRETEEERAKEGGRERDSYFAPGTAERGRRRPRRSPGSETAQRYSRGAPERVRITPACLSLFVLYLARRDHSVVLITQRVAMRAPRARSRSRECSRALRARARIVAQDWRDYRYLAICLQQQIGMRKPLNFQATRSRLLSNLVEAIVGSRPRLLDTKQLQYAAVEF